MPQKSAHPQTSQKSLNIDKARRSVSLNKESGANHAKHSKKSHHMDKTKTSGSTVKSQPTNFKDKNRRRTKYSSNLQSECLALDNHQFQLDNEFYHYDFAMRHLPLIETASAIIYIFKQLEFDQKYKIPPNVLTRFIICARQGYRDLPYHNWMHACSVTHFCFLLIKNLGLVKNGYISDLEAFSLIVSTLTHDIDHRGTNNQFEVCSESGLYKLYREYDTSIMERHHLDFTLAILNRDDCNLCESFTEKELKEFHRLLSHNILSTDISKHIANRESFFNTLSSFQKQNKEFRHALLSCIMTASDLCDSTKSWDDNLPIVESIFTEFFAQGDEERKMGWKPASMLDRNHAYIPEIEMKFLTHIVRPVYEQLAKTFPPIRVCVENIDHLYDLWLASTEVFNKYDDVHDPLDILALPEIEERMLGKTCTPSLLKRLRGKDFSHMRQGSIEGDSCLKDFKITNGNEENKWCCCIPSWKKKRKSTH